MENMKGPIEQLLAFGPAGVHYVPGYVQRKYPVTSFQYSLKKGKWADLDACVDS